MPATLRWLLWRNIMFPLSAAFFGLSVAGLVLDLVRWEQGFPHPLTLAFSVATAISAPLLALATRRLSRSVRYGRSDLPR